MVDDAKLAKYLLEHGSIENKVNEVIQEVALDYFFKTNDAVTRDRMMKEIEYQLRDIEEELDLDFNFTIDKNPDNYVYKIHFLDKTISFTVQAN